MSLQGSLWEDLFEILRKFCAETLYRDLVFGSLTGILPGYFLESWSRHHVQTSCTGVLVKRSLAEILHQDLPQQSCQEILKRPHTAQRSCEETSYRDLAQRSLTEILCGDLSWRPCTEILYRDLWQRSCPAISFSLLLAKGLYTGSLAQDLLHMFLQRDLILELLQRSCQRSWRDPMQRSCLQRDLAQELLQKSCQGDLERYH